MQRRCQSCGAENALGAHRAYHGAGVVLRCPACADVALRIGVREDRSSRMARDLHRAARGSLAPTGHRGGGGGGGFAPDRHHRGKRPAAGDALAALAALTAMAR